MRFSASSVSVSPTISWWQCSTNPPTLKPLNALRQAAASLSILFSFRAFVVTGSPSYRRIRRRLRALPAQGFSDAGSGSAILRQSYRKLSQNPSHLLTHGTVFAFGFRQDVGEEFLWDAREHVAIDVRFGLPFEFVG